MTRPDMIQPPVVSDPEVCPANRFAACAANERIYPHEWERHSLGFQHPPPYVELFARQPRLGWDSWGYGYESTQSTDPPAHNEGAGGNAGAVTPAEAG